MFEPTPHCDPIVPEDADSSHCLSVGTVVCVWNESLDRWTTGFSIAEITRSGYRLRRLSDGHLFDHVFAFGDVRLERRRDPFRGIEESYRDLGDTNSEDD